MRRRPLAVALVAWTFFVWTTRIANIWRDEALTTGEKWGRTGLAVSFTVLALAVVVTLWRRARQASLVAVGALAGWSVVVWVVRDVRIVAADHGAGFKAVHTVLAVVSIALAALAWREARRAAAPPAGAPGRDGAGAAPRPPVPTP
ncbi:MAG TPA: hypothetical protein VKZ72_01950 [Acidimicrobiales bacterium]|nr:hypothetical protein [Acidimicrobiales bacterium]